MGVQPEGCRCLLTVGVAADTVVAPVLTVNGLPVALVDRVETPAFCEPGSTCFCVAVPRAADAVYHLRLRACDGQAISVNYVELQSLV